MIDRLRLAFAALVLAFGLLAGPGSAFAEMSPGSVPCHDRTMTQLFAGQTTPMQNCRDGLVHKGCMVHASFVAVMAPAAPSAFVGIRMTAWTVLPPSSLTGAHIPPDTRPPIALI